MTGSKEITISLPENLHRVLTAMALLEGEGDTETWVTRYVSDTVKQDLEACLSATPENPIIDVEKVRWALDK